MRIPQRPPDINSIFEECTSERFKAILEAVGESAQPRKYEHWDKLRRLSPPDGLSHREWWAATKMQRATLLKKVPLCDTEGAPFWYAYADPISERLHEIDLHAGGQIAMPDPITNPQMRDRYIIGSLIEEAITSSQLEGAATTRDAAREMIRSGRKPRDRSEEMILNNYLTMQRIRELKNDKLTPSLVLELHRYVTRGTLDDPADEGHLREAHRKIEVAGTYNEVFHDPPPAGELEERMKAMCDFANGKSPKEFLHPVIRAIILHFWLAYDHPFVDGNGRAARALFYWCMLHNKYWLCEFISISEIILKGPSKYGRAFLYTETDGNDLTYFLLYHLDIIRRAVDQLHDFVSRKTQQVQLLERELQTMQFLNHRQRALVSHALRHLYQTYTFESHRRSHDVVYQTARTDLLDLAKRGILESWKEGREWHFKPAKDIEAKLQVDE